MDATLLSLTGFAVAMYITPGPNNSMLASSGANHGLRATVPHMLGIAAGFILILVLVDAGLGATLRATPWLLPFMRWGGAAWMLILAWKIATAPPPRTGVRTLLRSDTRLRLFNIAMALVLVVSLIPVLTGD